MLLFILDHLVGPVKGITQVFAAMQSAASRYQLVDTNWMALLHCIRLPLSALGSAPLTQIRRVA